MTRRADDTFDSRREGTKRRNRQRQRDKVGRNPCPCRPAAPTGATITVLTDEQVRHAKYRLQVTWNEVTTDTDGFVARKIDRYVVQLQHSDDGSTWNDKPRRKVVDAKDKDDDDTVDAIFRGVRRRRYYRVRVRAVDKKGCKSDFSSWTSATRVGASDAPNGVGTITRTRVGPRRIEFDWEDTDAPDFDRYKVVIRKADTETGTYETVRTRYVRNSSIAVHVPEADKTKWWKVRVRVQTTPDADGARAESGDNDSDADQADDTTGSGNTVITFSHPGVIPAPRLFSTGWTADRNYNIVKIRVRAGVHDADTHPDGDGTPQGGPLYVQVRKYDVDDDEFVKVFTSDSRLTIEENTHKDVAWADDMNVTTIDENETFAIRVTKDEDNTFTGRGLVVNIVLEPA